MTRRALLLGMTAFAAPPLHAEEAVRRYRITGLFGPERVDDLKALFAKLEGLRLVSVDFDESEASLSFDPARLFPGANEQQVVERLNDLVRNNSRATFGIRARCTVPKDKLQRVEIPVAGLDCKACTLAAYESIAFIDGVERATASFKTGLITATIDPTKTNREALEKALKARNVELR